MASTYLTKTFSTPTNRKKWTVSVWLKLLENTSYAGILDSGGDNAFIINSDNTFYCFENGGANMYLRPNMLFRDYNAWYHLVYAVDTTQASSGDRAKMYVNGEQITSFITQTQPSLNYESVFNNASTRYIGRNVAQGGYWNGSMAHYHFIDGTQYAASDFGQTDSTTGIWIPKTAPSVTYGNNGFFLKFENSAAMGTDSSGNGNDFSLGGGTLTPTKDTPTNNFPTWNRVDKDGVASLTNGNLTFTSSASGGSSNTNMGMYAGKWYFEVKHTSVNNAWLGIVPQNLYKFGTDLFTANYTAGVYAGNPNLYLNGVSQGSLGGGLTTNDIIMYAVDMDNNQIYIGKNGNWNDGLAGGFDQADFSNANAYSFNRYDDFYVLAGVNGSGSTGYAHQTNFGNGYFGTTAVSSGNADGDGYGTFEYAPPTGYYALCTKNIASYG